ncbi:MAG: hypothetical protein P8L85_24265 [Rubripirellula sp.]|nr:hypothetical protein [Rubripirellula sp.]
MSQQTPAETLCIVGGGTVIDAIRQLDSIHPADPDMVHWMCVDSLQTTFQLVASWFDWSTIVRPGELQTAMTGGFSTVSPTLLAVSSFYYPAASFLTRITLPHDWRTTTDSIAALLAIETEADELVLLKSCEVDHEFTPQQLAEQGIVDDAFPEIAEGISVIRIERL